MAMCSVIDQVLKQPSFYYGEMQKFAPLAPQL
jgi:hypothetical protein